MTARDEWRWTDERGVQRLVGTDELRAALASSVLPPSTLVWREGMKEWAPAFTMPELASAAIAAARSGDDENTQTDVNRPKAGGPAAGRPEMRTLLGLNAPEAKDRQSVPNLPIVVPTAGGAPSAARDVITQLPKFSGSTPTEGSSPAIPPAPRMPGRPAEPASAAPSPPAKATTSLASMPRVRQRTQTMQGVGLQRSKTTSDIDSLWAAPASNPDPADDAPTRTRPRPAAGVPAEVEATGDRPSSTDVDDLEIVSERVPGPPKMPDFRSAQGQGTAADARRGDASKAPGPPPKRSAPPPPPRRQPSIPPGATGARLDAHVAAKPGSLKAPPTGFEGRAGQQRPQAPPLPPKRGGSERPPMKSTPPPPPKRSHPPPPLRTRTPMGGTAAASGEAGGDSAAVAALDAASSGAIEVDASTDALLVEASKTPAPVAVAEAKKTSLEPTPLMAAATSTTPVASTASATGASKSDAAASAAPPSAAPATAAPATAAATPAAKSATATPIPSAGKATPSPAAKPAAGAGAKVASSPSSTATPTPEPARAPPPVAASARKVEPEPSAAPPPARAPFPNKADLSGTPTAPVAQRDEVGRARVVAARVEVAATDASDEVPGTRRPRNLREPVSVPVSSLMIAGGALIVMAMTGFLVGRCSSPTPTARPQPTSTTHPTSATAATTGATTSASPPKPCWVVRQPVMWAPRASKTIPFELLTTPSSHLAVGYAREDTEGVGLDVDPKTGETKETFSQKAPDAIQHVMPNPSGGFTVLSEGSALKSALEVAGKSPFFVGVADGAIVTSDKADAPGPKLWSLPGSDEINAERIEGAGARGFAYTFRQGNSVFGGWLGADRRPVGELVKVAGSGGSVGKPMSGFNGKELAVIFADRPEGAAHWQIRIGRAAAGSVPAETKVIPLPKGGPGGDAFAPDITGLPDGRWLLVWTEGPPGGRAVRAHTLSATLQPVGDPIALSPPGGNYGQGVLGVVGDYAAVVFLSKGSTSFELWGAVLQCG